MRYLTFALGKGRLAEQTLDTGDAGCASADPKAPVRI